MVVAGTLSCHFVAPSCKIELARFSARLRIQDGAECGNIGSILGPKMIERKGSRPWAYLVLEFVDSQTQ